MHVILRPDEEEITLIIKETAFLRVISLLKWGENYAYYLGNYSFYA